MPHGNKINKKCQMGKLMRVEQIQTPPPIVAPSSVITDDEAGAMFRAAVNLFSLWKLTDKQASVLLDLPVRSYARWKAGGARHFSRDQKTRLSNIMGIHKALRIVFHEPQRGYDWVKARQQGFWRPDGNRRHA